MRTLLALPLVLACAVAAQAQEKVLLITGANNHDWKATTARLQEILEAAKIQVVVETDPDAPALADAAKLKDYGAIVLNYNRGKRWDPVREANLLQFVKDGGGLVVVHASNNAFDGWEEFDKLVGGTWRSKGTHYPERGTFHPPYGEFEVQVVDTDHPITKGVASFKTRDEMYSNLRLQPNIKVLAQGVQPSVSKPQPLVFVLDYGKGRVFHTALGHDLVAMKSDGFVETLTRGTKWAAGGKSAVQSR
ncbi:MAG: ThuA domain-containing protein [Isosphaeraceae bacterium]